jgi:hypothetical protein
MTREGAVAKARRLAAAGPRVAAVVRDLRGGGFDALPGYVCAADNDKRLLRRLRQVALVDPDGVVYERRGG